MLLVPGVSLTLEYSTTKQENIWTRAMTAEPTYSLEMVAGIKSGDGMESISLIFRLDFSSTVITMATSTRTPIMVVYIRNGLIEKKVATRKL